MIALARKSEAHAYKAPKAEAMQRRNGDVLFEHKRPHRCRQRTSTAKLKTKYRSIYITVLIFAPYVLIDILYISIRTFFVKSGNGKKKLSALNALNF